jgi:hypothetical protein
MRAKAYVAFEKGNFRELYSILQVPTLSPRVHTLKCMYVHTCAYIENETCQVLENICPWYWSRHYENRSEFRMIDRRWRTFFLVEIVDVFYNTCIGVRKIYKKSIFKLWRRGLVISSPPSTEDIGAMGREIESRQGIGRQLLYLYKNIFKKLSNVPDSYLRIEAPLKSSGHVVPRSLQGGRERQGTNSR